MIGCAPRRTTAALHESMEQVQKRRLDSQHRQIADDSALAVSIAKKNLTGTSVQIQPNSSNAEDDNDYDSDKENDSEYSSNGPAVVKEKQMSPSGGVAAPDAYLVGCPPPARHESRADSCASRPKPRLFLIRRRPSDNRRSARRDTSVTRMASARRRKRRVLVWLAVWLSPTLLRWSG